MRTNLLKLALGLCISVAAALPASAALLYNGKIALTDESNNIVGYVSQSYNAFGESRISDAAGALNVSFTGASRFSMLGTNSASPATPFLGGIKGFANTSADLGLGSFNYAYFGGTEETSVGATPALGANSFTAATGLAEEIESAIRSISGDAISSTWVNSDSSTVGLFFVFLQGTLAMTADVDAFKAEFGAASVLTLSFVGDVVDTGSPVPEPGSLALLGLGFAGLAASRRRQKQA